MKISVSYFCILYLLSCTITSSVSFLIYQTSFKDEIIKVKTREQVLVHSNLDLVKNTLSEIQSDLVFLSSQNRLKYFLSTGDEEAKKVLQDDYILYSNLKKRYDQIRLLCQNGKELIRVNYTKTGAVKVPDDHLQVKNHRYYFRETVSRDDIYVTPMDLNVEYKKIEQPFKPVISTEKEKGLFS